MRFSRGRNFPPLSHKPAEMGTAFLEVIRLAKTRIDQAPWMGFRPSAVGSRGSRIGGAGTPRPALHLQGGRKRKSKQVLTRIPQSDNVQHVKSETPELPELISSLRKATAKRGMKAVLSRAMGVSLPRISEWLAGTREPGGEYALRLKRWVELPEDQQKSRGRASTPPQPKPRLRSSKANEKTKSGRPTA